MRFFQYVILRELEKMTKNLCWMFAFINYIFKKLNFLAMYKTL